MQELQSKKIKRRSFSNNCVGAHVTCLLVSLLKEKDGLAFRLVILVPKSFICVLLCRLGQS